VESRIAALIQYAGGHDPGPLADPEPPAETAGPDGQPDDDPQPQPDQQPPAACRWSMGDAGSARSPVPAEGAAGHAGKRQWPRPAVRPYGSVGPSGPLTAHGNFTRWKAGRYP